MQMHNMVQQWVAQLSEEPGIQPPCLVQPLMQVRPNPLPRPFSATYGSTLLKSTLIAEPTPSDDLTPSDELTSSDEPMPMARPSRRTSAIISRSWQYPHPLHERFQQRTRRPIMRMPTIGEEEEHHIHLYNGIDGTAAEDFVLILIAPGRQWDN
ncbi:uncharacterized protein LOC132915606 [Bombus pascuorum]|uniref:uncharacterized protein LOC132915605 n=1 Tax=Bombus pascuorum TaxID=65598 RepID=UPI00298E19C2|nr:uncharacterized protein LOC132915605 [Bombus pascuorum]XP_060831417.1 uncharacterized protein LOC132915606 [Bombus pascuorum]